MFLYLLQKYFSPFVLIVWWFFFCGSLAFAQKGKQAALTVSTANVIVNEYTSLTADALAGTNTLAVANSTLNANNRFAKPLEIGDLIFIIQVQGATLSARDSNQWNPFPSPKDSSWGMINNYKNCGNWEFAQVKNIPNNQSIVVDCSLAYSYTAAGKVVVVRVPRYSSLTINTGGSLTCDAWNGTIGGMCIIEVNKNTIINSGGLIQASGKGFRGGDIRENESDVGANEFASKNAKHGAEKGEGIIGYQNDYNMYGGMNCRGAPANGGGGGSSHNGGGGGGANAGDTSKWTGHGNPDNTPAGWTAAWNLQWAGFANSTSTGGGQGGYTFSGSNQNATTTAPGNAAWGGEYRRAWGGHGGRPLDYSKGKLFLGGGGGAGDANDGEGGKGANGGGLIFILCYDSIKGSGAITSNGKDGFNTTGAGTDGAGGGGAGGTIILNSFNAITGITATANGGKGGNQVISGFSVLEAEGPGGGGGGGYIATSNSSITKNVSAGSYGTTNSFSLTEFISNGATGGGAGISKNDLTHFIIGAPDVSICAGQSTTLSATLNGTVPSGTTIVWYDSLAGGTVIGTGNMFTTPVLSAGSYTYYVGTCPGIYHQPVVVKVTSSPTVSAGTNTTICLGESITLAASGGISYSWSPAMGLSSSTIANPIAIPSITTTYILTATTVCGNATNSVVITVKPSLSPSISGNTSICAGGSSTLTASGGSSYEWSTGANTNMIIVSPSATTTYSVSSKGLCAGSNSITVNVIAGITASISGNTTICAGSSTTLTASGGTAYSWSSGEALASIVISPTTSTTYSVTVSVGNCSSKTSIHVTIASNIVASIAGITSLCSGNSATLTASGGNTYVWSTGAIASSIIVSPTSSTTYSVLAAIGSCTAAATQLVNVTPTPTLLILSNPSSTTICAGDSVSLTASGGINYGWSTGATSSSISITPTGNTTYSVQTTLNGCTVHSSLPITVMTKPQAGIVGAINICKGEAATLTATGGAAYLWNTGATTATIQPNTSGTYSVVAQVGSCKSSAAHTVTVHANPTAGISPNTIISQGETTTLTASGGVNYVWTNSTTGNPIAVSPVATTTFCVTVIDGYGCKDTACATISVVECTGEPYLPTAFSPNNDGSNDVLRLYFNFPFCIKALDLCIYNRWGEKIFETNDPTFTWNGVYNKGLLKETNAGNTGVYVYYMKVKLVNGKEFTKKGDISIIR
jgi:gliding motility-associated-like protein